MRPDKLSVRFPQAKGMSGFGDPAEKRIKNERKIKLNGIENGMIPRKKTDKKGKENKANGVSGFGNPAEKEGQKRKRKIKLNGVENGMIQRKKQIKKGKECKVNGVSGFGNLMSRKEAENRKVFRHVAGDTA